jgi:hypothetical protein
MQVTGNTITMYCPLCYDAITKDLRAQLTQLQARCEETETRYVEQLERADAAVGDRSHQTGRVLAENRALLNLERLCVFW